VPVPSEGNRGPGAVVVPGAGAVVVPGAGAVVVSGASEAGGGSELSVSDGGRGASLFGAPGLAGPVPAVWPPCGSGFFFAFCETDMAGCSAASPNFARNWSIRFFAWLLSSDPGCCRITSL
jgi:hypothetical protein